MPLLNKRPFERAQPPTDLKPSDKVYYLEPSNEIFQAYEDFFERTIQLNSTIWSCEFTGKNSLTFFEAQQSESEAMQALDDYPSYLMMPVRYIVQKFTCRGRFDDLLNDIFKFMGDRYFIGEHCFYMERNKRMSVMILESSVVGDYNIDADQVNAREIAAPSPEMYSYKIQILDDGFEESLEDEGLRENIRFEQLSRFKNILSKPKLRLLLRNCCYLEGDRFKIKERYLKDKQERDITALDWSLVLGGPLPIFPQTPAQHRGRQPKTPSKPKTENGSAETPASTRGKRKSEGGRKMTEKKRQQIQAQQEDLQSTFEKARKLNVDLTSYEQTDKMLSNDDIVRLREAIKEAREKEREIAKELKKKKLKAKMDYHKKRDDLECDDLKILPAYPAIPLPSWVTDEDFAEFIYILQFFYSFQELLPVKEVRGTTSKVTLADLIQAIRCSDPELSPYADLMKVLLSARTDRSDEEDGDEADLTNKDEIQLVQLMKCDPDHPVFGDDIRGVTNLHEDLRRTHGVSVRHLPVDWMTLTEVLLLTLRTSGYYSGQRTHRHRLFPRGNYRGYEDPGFVFLRENPELVEKMRVGTVFDLEPRERLLLMRVIIDQLLSYSKFRTSHDENISQLLENRRQLKKLRYWHQSQDHEAREAQLAREYELEKCTEAGTKAEPLSSSKDSDRIRAHVRALREGRRTDTEEFEQLLLAGVTFPEFEPEDISSVREWQQKYVKVLEDDLIATVYELSCLHGDLRLGRDRAFRSYFVMESIPLVVVETPQDADHIGVCYDATPISDYSEFGSEESARGMVFGCTGSMDTCTVHGPKRHERPRFSFIDDPITIDQIISACNPRGFREIDLAEELTYLKDPLCEATTRILAKKENNQLGDIFFTNKEDPALKESALDLHQEFVELILELEDKMEQGLLGRLECDRLQWRKLLQDTWDVTSMITSNIMLKCRPSDDVEILVNQEKIAEMSTEQKLAVALLQIVHGIQFKFYKLPFVHIRSDEGVPKPTGVFVNWQRELIRCSSISSLFLFLSTLEPTILWDKSRLQGKCRKCRKKGAAETLALCADCDKCFHLECVRLPANQPAPLDWACPDCASIRKKAATIEKRKATIEARLAAEAEKAEHDQKEDFDVTQSSIEDSLIDEEDQSPDENSLNTADVENRMVEVTRSGRAVRKVVYKDLGSPQIKNSRRMGTRSNGNVFTETEDEDYNDSESTESISTPVRTSTRKRPATQATPASSRATPIRVACGLRDMDSSSREKMSKLEQIIKDVKKETYSWPFLEPVDEKDAPDYYEVIDNPIDLRTMMNKVKQYKYDAPEEVRDDMLLMVENCRKYNEEGSEVYECAEQINDFFNYRLREVFDAKRRRRE